MNAVVSFTIRRAGSRAIVLANGEPVGSWMALHKAKERAEALTEQGTYRMRKCMCCPTTFLSEGAHNRLCTSCRQKGASAEAVAV